MPIGDAARTTDPPQDCLTPDDRALLNAVFGWHMPGAACIAPPMDAQGRPLLIPLMAWIIADARRHGDVDGAFTADQFAAAACAINRSPTMSLRLSAAQIARGLRHLQSVDPASRVPLRAGERTLNAGREAAAAG